MRLEERVATKAKIDELKSKDFDKLTQEELNYIIRKEHIIHIPEVKKS